MITFPKFFHSSLIFGNLCVSLKTENINIPNKKRHRHKDVDICVEIHLVYVVIWERNLRMDVS